MCVCAGVCVKQCSRQKRQPRQPVQTKNKISISNHFCRKMNILALPLIGFIAAVNQCEMQMCQQIESSRVETDGSCCCDFHFRSKRHEHAHICAPMASGKRLRPITISLMTAYLFTCRPPPSLNRRTAACWRKSCAPKLNQLFPQEKGWTYFYIHGILVFFFFWSLAFFWSIFLFSFFSFPIL